MDLILIVLGFIFLLLGILGSFLPVLPGIPLSWLGLLVLHFSSAVPMNFLFLGTTLVVSLVILLLQYVIPAFGTKHFGGSRYGMAGATIGLVVGIFTPIPLAVFLMPFAGAFIGEILNRSGSRTALRAATGSFLGLLASTFVELLAAVSFMILFLYKVWNFREGLF